MKKILMDLRIQPQNSEQGWNWCLLNSGEGGSGSSNIMLL